MSIEAFAKDELERAGWFDKDGMYGDMMGHAVMKMIQHFYEEGRSGMSASIAVDLFKKLAAWEPLTPLTGDDDEWWDLSEYGDKGTLQNKRCPRVFKGSDGRSYDIEGRIFREPDGVSFTSGDSRVYIDFPYTPTTEYVDVPANRD